MLTFVFIPVIVSQRSLEWGAAKEGFVALKMLKIQISDILISSLSLFFRQQFFYIFLLTFKLLTKANAQSIRVCVRALARSPVVSVCHRKRKFSLKFFSFRCHSYTLMAISFSVWSHREGCIRSSTFFFLLPAHSSFTDNEFDTCAIVCRKNANK